MTTTTTTTGGGHSAALTSTERETTMKTTNRTNENSSYRERSIAAERVASVLRAALGEEERNGGWTIRQKVSGCVSSVGTITIFPAEQEDGTEGPEWSWILSPHNRACQFEYGDLYDLTDLWSLAKDNGLDEIYDQLWSCAARIENADLRVAMAQRGRWSR